MKRPSHVMTQNELAILYDQLNYQPLEVDESFVAKAIEQCRLDSRLAEITCEFIRDYWWKLDGKTLNKKLKNRAWPETILPMLEEIELRCEGTETEKRAFRKWSHLTQQGIKNFSPQMYYFRFWIPGSLHLKTNLLENKEWFQKHKFISKETFFNKNKPRQLSMGKSRLSEKNRHKLDLAMRLRQALKNQGYSTQEAALLLGTDKTTISLIYRGLVSTISLDFLYDLKEKLKDKLKEKLMAKKEK